MSDATDQSLKPVNPNIEINSGAEGSGDGALVFYHNAIYVEGRHRQTTSGISLRTGSMSSVFGHPSPDLVLSRKAEQMCVSDGLDYKGLMPVQRLFLTHFRCPTCKLLPLYYLNLSHPKKVRCARCNTLVRFKNSGKYGKIRKRIAFALWISSEVGAGVQ